MRNKLLAIAAIAGAMAAPIAAQAQSDTVGVVRGNTVVIGESEGITVDQLVLASQLPVQQVLSTLSVLEMRRLVRRLSGNLVARR